MDAWEALRDEKNHIEGLLNQRFNFLMIVVGLIAASIPYINTPLQFKLVICIGAILALFLTLLIGRAKRRLTISLGMLAKERKDPTDRIREKADEGFSLFSLSMVWIMIALPVLVTIGLFTVLWFSDILYYSYLMNETTHTLLSQSEFLSWLLSSKVILQVLSGASGVLGIAFSLYGSVKLFSEIKLPNTIDPIPLDDRLQEIGDAPASSDNAKIKHNFAVIEQVYKDLVKKLNDEVINAGATNNEEYRKAKARFIPYIKWGAVMAFLSIAISFILSLI